LEDDAQLHWSPHKEVNSIAINIKHMSGNMVSRWTDFLTTDGEKPDRNRDGEFEAGDLSRKELLGIWERGWSVVFAVMKELSEADLQRIVHIKQKPLTVMQAIVHQIAHYAYHVGQIVHIAKTLKEHRFESLSIPKKK
jgi:Protein of unknown function (DUF1572)